MPRFLKTGLLVVLLLVPVFAFLFLYRFGDNRFTLRHFGPYTLSEESSHNGTADTVFHQVPDFELTSQEGKPVGTRQLAGSVYVADFFFATCQSICPKMSTQLGRVQEMFRENDQVKLVSYSVNPAHDTVAVLQQYARRYNARPGKWFLLTGPKKEIYELARTGYYLPVAEGDGGPDDFIHSDKLVLVDPDRHIRGFYDGTDPKEVDRLITEIRVLLREYGLDEKQN